MLVRLRNLKGNITLLLYAPVVQLLELHVGQEYKTQRGVEPRQS